MPTSAPIAGSAPALALPSNGHNMRSTLRATGDKNDATAAANRAPVTKARAGNVETIQHHLTSVLPQNTMSRSIGYSCECLKKLAVNEVAAEEMIDNGVVEAMHKAVLRHPNNTELMRQWLDCLAALSQTPRLAAMVAARLGHNYTWLAAAIGHADPKDPSGALQSSACRLIDNLCEYRPAIDHMIRDGVFDALNGVPQRFPREPVLLAAVARTLRHFTDHSVQCCEVVTQESNSIGTLIQALNQHPELLVLSSNVLALLASILLRTSQTDQLQQTIDTLLSHQIIPAISMAVEHHPYDENLLQLAASILQQLTGQSELEMAIQQCTFAPGESVQLSASLSSGLVTLSSLLLVEDSVEYVLQHLRFEWILKILREALQQSQQHKLSSSSLSSSSNVELQDITNRILPTACRILQRLLINSEACGEFQLAPDGVELLCAAQQVDSPLALEAALTTLGHCINKCDTQTGLLVCMRTVQYKDCIALLHRVISIHSLKPKTQSDDDKTKSEIVLNARLLLPDLTLLKGLVSQSDTHSHLQIDQLIPLLVGVVLGEHLSASIRTLAIQILGMLALSAARVQAMCDAAGGRHKLTRCLLDMLSSADHALVQAALQLLDTLSLLPVEAEYMLAQNDVLKLLQNVLTRNLSPLHNELANRLLALLRQMQSERDGELSAAQLAEQARLLAQQQADEAERLRRDAELRLAEEEARRRAQRLAEIEALSRMQLQHEEELRREFELEQKRAAEEDARRRAAALAEAARLAQEAKAQEDADEESEMLQALERMKIQEMETAAMMLSQQQAQRVTQKPAKSTTDEAKRNTTAPMSHMEQLLARQGGAPAAKPAPRTGTTSGVRSVRDRFADDPDYGGLKPQATLSPDALQFLLAGETVTRHFVHGASKVFHLYLSVDQSYLAWRRSGKELEIANTMSCFSISGVPSKGRSTPALQRTATLSSRFLVNENCAFAFSGITTQGQVISLDLEAQTPEKRNLWVQYVSELVAVNEHRKLFGGASVQIQPISELNVQSNAKSLPVSALGNFRTLN